MGCCKSVPSRRENPDDSQHSRLDSLADDNGSPSVYVENLPWNISAAQIQEGFKSFGEIKPAKIRVRVEGSSACAILEFETRASAARAIQASPFIMCGRRVSVMEKRSSVCKSDSADNTREECRAGRYKECFTPYNSPNAEELEKCRNSPYVGECSTSCKPPNTEELEECEEFSFPILI